MRNEPILVNHLFFIYISPSEGTICLETKALISTFCKKIYRFEYEIESSFLQQQINTNQQVYIAIVRRFFLNCNYNINNMYDFRSSTLEISSCHTRFIAVEKKIKDHSKHTVRMTNTELRQAIKELKWIVNIRPLKKTVTIKKIT